MAIWDKNAAVSIFFLTILVTTASAVDSGKVLTAEDFVKHRVPRCSSGSPISLLVQISPKLSPYQLMLITEPVAAPDGGIHHVGRIEISKAGSGAILQTIEVISIWDHSLCEFFDAMDVNFDGYLDLAVVRDGGAKWASRDYYLFDPQSDRFITNALTQDLDQVQDNGIVLDSKTHEIQAPFTGPGTSPGGVNIYTVEHGQLVRVQEEKVPADNRQCIKKTKRRVNGKWRVVKVEKMKALF